jgi:hypothetical protein
MDDSKRNHLQHSMLPDPSKPSHVRVYATMTDLNGYPVHANQPRPVLRRAVSGHLFQATNQIFKGSELTKRESVSLDRVPIRGPVGFGVLGAKDEKYTGHSATEDRDCVDEDEKHRCWIGELGEFDRSDSETVCLVGREERYRRMKCGADGDDVWVQIAREYERPKTPS